MPTKVTIADQVLKYLRELSPEPRRRLKAALMSLAHGTGDTKPLQGNLEGFSRLRVGEHRAVYRYHDGQIQVFYVAPRSLVYEFLAAHLHEMLNE